MKIAYHIKSCMGELHLMLTMDALVLKEWPIKDFLVEELFATLCKGVEQPFDGQLVTIVGKDQCKACLAW